LTKRLRNTRVVSVGYNAWLSRETDISAAIGLSMASSLCLQKWRCEFGKFGA